MAKNRSIIQLSGTLGKITFVNSKAYGEHVREPRGSIKPAIPNAALQESSEHLKVVNVIAKLVFDPVKNLRGEFTDSYFWPALLKAFRNQEKNNSAYTFKHLNGIEIRKDRPLSKLMNVSIKETAQGVLLVPAFKNSKRSAEANGFLLTLMHIVCPADLSDYGPVDTQSHFLRFDTPNPELLFNFDALPYPDAQIVYCLKAETAFNGKSLKHITGTGMRLLVADN